MTHFQVYREFDRLHGKTCVEIHPSTEFKMFFSTLSNDYSLVKFLGKVHAGVMRATCFVMPLRYMIPTLEVLMPLIVFSTHFQQCFFLCNFNYKSSKNF